MYESGRGGIDQPGGSGELLGVKKGAGNGVIYDDLVVSVDPAPGPDRAVVVLGQVLGDPPGGIRILETKVWKGDLPFRLLVAAGRYQVLQEDDGEIEP